jgi:hypothetical protein
VLIHNFHKNKSVFYSTVALDTQSKGSHSGSSGGSHEPFFSTDFPTLRRNPDSKLALKDNSTKIIDKPDEQLKRSANARQPDMYESQRQSALISSTAPKDSSSHLRHQHQHVEENRSSSRHSGLSNASRLFAGNMTPEEMALVLEAAQAFVDPPERFSTKSSKSVHVGPSCHKQQPQQHHSPSCYALNERSAIIQINKSPSKGPIYTAHLGGNIEVFAKLFKQTN